MIIIGAKRADLDKALERVTALYESNIIFNNGPEHLGFTRDGREKWRLTLRALSSFKPGARRSHTGRRMAAACWHVHGRFFQALPAGVTIKAGTLTLEPSSPWNDFNIGSIAFPLLYSEACDCGGAEAMPEGTGYNLIER